MIASRKTQLRSALQSSYSPEEIDYFLGYELTKQDIEFIKETAREVLLRFPYQAFNCAAMSAMWAAIIKDHSKIPVAAICGHLHWKESLLFYCKENLPTTNTVTLWDGHCWLEFGGLIADISIFRTLAGEKRLHHLNAFMTQKLGSNNGLLCMHSDTLDQFHMQYTPCFSLTDLQINGLINGLS